jgi:hypothetical protein
MLYLLQFCPPQVKTCFGCGQALKPGGEIGRAPCDLVIVSNAKRSYYDNTGTLKERPGNVYYHANTGCLKRQQAYFVASLVQTPEAIKNKLTQEHIVHLREFGLCI